MTNEVIQEYGVEAIFNSGLYLTSNFGLLGKYFLFNEVVVRNRDSSFSLI